MDRRTFIAALAAVLGNPPLGATAQPAGKLYRVGLISAASAVSVMAGAEPSTPTPEHLCRPCVPSKRLNELILEMAGTGERIWTPGS
jgi:hypothetical protein